MANIEMLLSCFIIETLQCICENFIICASKSVIHTDDRKTMNALIFFNINLFSINCIIMTYSLISNFQRFDRSSKLSRTRTPFNQQKTRSLFVYYYKHFNARRQRYNHINNYIKRKRLDSKTHMNPSDLHTIMKIGRFYHNL